MKNFGDSERHVLSLFSQNSEFEYKGNRYRVVESDKPTTPSGEPKTDVYVRSVLINTNEILELKISYKKDNADFLENKITAERAEQIFGPCWKEIVKKSTLAIRNNFGNSTLIYKKSKGRTSAGSITLGWRFELLNKPGGTLSGLVKLTPEQIIDVYAGRNLEASKKNATVNGRTIVDSGVANFIINCDVTKLNSIQDAVNSIIPIEEFAKSNSRIYFACKALNYRSFVDKIEGNRCLSVFVNWEVTDGKLDPKLVFDDPLLTRGNVVRDKLLQSMKLIKITNTDDITENNVSSLQIIH